MRTLPLLLTLAPAALAAQAPAAPAPATAPTLEAQLKAQSAGIEALKKADPAAALAKIEAIIPAVPPAFNKADFAKAQESMGEYNALTGMYRIAASSADSAGQWEKAKEYAAKAKANAQVTCDDATPAFLAYQDTWKKAMDEAQKSLDEMAALQKVEKPTPDQVKRLAFLKENEPVFQKNVVLGRQMVAAVDGRLKDLKDQPADFDPFISNIDTRLKTEGENIAKSKGDKKVFVAAAVKSAGEYKDKDAETTYLRRLLVLDPSNKEAAHKILVLRGEAKDEPVTAKHGTRKKKGH